MKFFIIMLFIIVAFPVNAFFAKPINMEKKQSVTSETITPSPTSLATEYAKLLTNYTQTLLQYGEQVGSNGMKWKKYLNLPGNDTNTPTGSQYYYGLYYGVSGIGTYFLNLYEASKNSSYLSIAEKAGTYLLSKALYSPNLSVYAWGKSEDDLMIYTGEKYGEAGIVSFLLSLYQDSGNSTYRQYAESTLQFLLDFSSETPFGYMWNYTAIFLQSQITDIIYGVTGIAKAYLDAYQVTNNQTYLNICLKAMSWVLNQTEYTSLNGNGLRRVRYSPDPSYNYFFTGYQSGAAGIGDFLLTLYNVTKEPNYLLYAKQMANWLVYEENGTGYWTNYNAVDYITNQMTTNQEGTYLGYSAGVSGVAMFFMDLFKETNNTQYLGPVQRVKNYLLKEAETNGTQMFWKVQVNGTFDNRVQTDLSLGEAGIGLFFIKYYELFGTPDVLTVLDGIYNFYVDNTESNGLVPYVIGASEPIYDSSYFDGLTGITTFLLEVNKTVLQPSKYTSSILNNIGSYDYSNSTTWIALYSYSEQTITTTTSQSSSTTVNTSKTTNSMDFTSLMYALVITFIVIGISRKKRKVR